MPSIFDNKVFNSEVFGKYVDTVSDLKRNELLKSGALNVRNDLRAMFPDQTGGHYAVIPMKAPIGGDAVNYDGSTDITATSRMTYSQGMIVVGRAKGFTEKDFSYDITGGNDFLPVASEVAHYWDNVDQATILSVLKGIFSMTGTKNAEFVNAHTTDISALETNVVGASTLNSAIQKATGDNKNIFTVAIMHSAVSTNLENLNLINYLKYTDSTGVERELQLGTWNGRIVLVDDNMPTSQIATAYGLTSDLALVDGKTYYTRSGSSPNYVYTPVASPDVANIATYYEVTATDTLYTTYVLGKGAFDYCDVGAKVPYEMARDAKTNGGETTLYTRQRKLFAPKGISYAPAQIPLSPLASSLEAGASWKLAQNANASAVYPHKAIPIARIISRG